MYHDGLQIAKYRVTCLAILKILHCVKQDGFKAKEYWNTINTWKEIFSTAVLLFSSNIELIPLDKPVKWTPFHVLVNLYLDVFIIMYRLSTGSADVVCSPFALVRSAELDLLHTRKFKNICVASSCDKWILLLSMYCSGFFHHIVLYSIVLLPRCSAETEVLHSHYAK